VATHDTKSTFFWKSSIYIIDERDILVSIKEAVAQTPVMKRGESSILRVSFEGRPGQVVSVKAVVREAPHNFYVLNDNGREEDERAGDDVWTGRIDVVADAVPGEYHLDIHAFDRNWNPIFLPGTV
jgi:hypothetical protein